MIEVVSADAIESALEPWQDIAVIEQNTELPRATFHAYASPQLAIEGARTDDPYYRSLNGSWRFHWSAYPEARPKSFFKADYDTSSWDSIAVPSVWERRGHGYPIYENIAYPFRAEPFEVPVDDQNHVGSYLKTFDVPSDWNGRQIYVRFGAVSSAMTVWVNGERVGYHQGSRTPTEFDLTGFVNSGDNTLAVEVMRWSDASWLENQDSWSLSGIFRDVELYARPKTQIRDFFASTTLTNNYQDGVLDLSVDLRAYEVGVAHDGGGWLLAYEVTGNDIEPRESESKRFASGSLPVSFANGAASTSTQAIVKDVMPWSAECPALYHLTLTLIDPDNVPIEVIHRKIGFRSVELKNGRALINGYPVKFRGVNVHEFHTEHGYVVDEETLRKDFQLLKAGNFNAVRTSHYPQAPRFYELADQYGIYVVDEANLETHLYRYTPELAPARKPQWAKQMLDRTIRMIERDKNHPSIVFWSPGNETGPGDNMTAIYKWAKNRDPSRLFQYADDTNTEGGNFSELDERPFGRASDILSAFYASPWSLEQYAQEHNDRPWIMMEYWHSMGNSLGNGREYWNTINRHSVLQGGFIWDWVDQGLREVDEDGRVWYGQGGDYGPVDVPSSNNFLHNGVVFPDRTVKPAYWDVKKAYQPARFEPYDLSGGKIRIHNLHHFTNLVEFDVHWQVLLDGEVVRKGVAPCMPARPGGHAVVELGKLRPRRLQAGGEYFLNVQLRRRAGSKDPSGLLDDEHVVASEQLALPFTEEVVATLPRGEVVLLSSNESLQVVGKNFRVRFDVEHGIMTSYEFNDTELLQESPIPNLWRAFTDNDYGFQPLTWDFDWREAGRSRRLTQFSVDDSDRAQTRIDTAFELTRPDGRLMATVDIVYTVRADATVAIDVQFSRDDGASMPPRVGLRLAVPEAFDQLTWYGAGPHENYSDRHWSAYIGRYQGPVADQYVPYLRLQENGYKTNTRWFLLENEQGVGLGVFANGTVGFSALPNPLEDFEAGSEVWQQASQDDRRKPTTHLNDRPRERQGVFVHVDAIQAGVGGDNSWAKRTHNAYTPREPRYAFGFVLKGLDTTAEAVASTARSLSAR